jgi:hypothetical protein
VLRKCPNISFVFLSGFPHLFFLMLHYLLEAGIFPNKKSLPKADIGRLFLPGQ